MLHIIFMILGEIVAAVGFYLLFSTLRNTMMLSPGNNAIPDSSVSFAPALIRLHI